MRRSPIGEPREVFVEPVSAFVCRRRRDRRRSSALTPLGRKLTRVNRSSDRSLPNRLRRLTWKNPRGATWNSSTASAGLRRSHQPLAAFEPAAVADRRHRRFLDGDDDVAAVLLAGKLEIRDVDAAEQPERRDARARLVFLLLRERLPALQLHFAENRVARRALVADDQHVIDQNLRPLVDGEAELDLRSVADGLRRGLAPSLPGSRDSDTAARCCRRRRKSAARNTAGPGADVIGAAAAYRRRWPCCPETSPSR